MILPLFTFVQRYIEPLWQAVKQALRRWMKLDNHSLPLNAALDMTRSKPELLLENALLRQQIIILERQSKHPKLTWRDRILIVLLASKLRAWKDARTYLKNGVESVSALRGRLSRWTSQTSNGKL